MKRTRNSLVDFFARQLVSPRVYRTRSGFDCGACGIPRFAVRVSTGNIWADPLAFVAFRPTSGHRNRDLPTAVCLRPVLRKQGRADVAARLTNGHELGGQRNDPGINFLPGTLNGPALTSVTEWSLMFVPPVHRKNSPPVCCLIRQTCPKAASRVTGFQVLSPGPREPVVLASRHPPLFQNAVAYQ